MSSREVADHVAELLTEFTRTERTRARLPGDAEPMDYFFEMLSASPGRRTARLLRTHIGNQALYYSASSTNASSIGRAVGFPDISYYEGPRRGQFCSGQP